MSVYYIQPVDPQELAGRFSTEDTFAPLPRADEEWKERHLDKIKAVLDRLPDREADLIRLYYFLNKRQTDIAEIFNITQAAVSYRLKRALDRIKFLIEIPEVSKQELYDDLLPHMPTKLDAQIFSEMFESTCQSEVADILNISQGRVRHRFIANLARMGQVLVDRIRAWAKTNDTELVEVRTIQTSLDALSERQRAEPELEAKDFEEDLNAIVDQLRDLPDELRDEELILFARYYKTFVKIRYNFNILREIKLPKWSNRSKKMLT